MVLEKTLESPLDCKEIKPVHPGLKEINPECCFPGSSVGKEFACNAEDSGSIPGFRRSSGEGKDYPLQYSGLESSMDCLVQGVTRSQTQLSDFHFHFIFIHWKN